MTAPGGDNAFQRPSPAISGNVYQPFPITTVVVPGTECYGSAGRDLDGVTACGRRRRAHHQSDSASDRRTAIQAASDGNGRSNRLPAKPVRFPGGIASFAATCVGGTGYNGFYGHGQVNALSAVTSAR